ncbi:hypothetical protein [Pseudobacteroides cellulosolvens]|uniref:Uncharacterized protein n=1 Tax=Pseudobacteroides cellulosolvens ATCC 35603 = DSM 2933 TaxID=398512 RepID=A0A0L6JR99_9FIRM|nr:hypothetical protein [Pseudobacteroides cellulosolvens]KNY27917.1 hypothetical protein Bccel_3188 [Pseudobacteroides cellulosolvens ATCC 35603 = DSM 2933]KNY27923.1 hypothetical protein Bccel_3194 [Pseudobacteroides cellulosolvens ATCC 35603 = DSM 2933]
MLQILKDFFGSINWSTVITAIPISALVGSFFTYMLNGRREKQKSKKEIIRSAKIINLDLILQHLKG